MEVLRFLTAGSVDDGKSTLIGRILYESGALKKDQLATIAALDSGNAIDYSLFTDGLGFERANKITLDVSYQYFSTAKRRFIIADCPGHAEYTRNMISGASTASTLVLMLNAAKGIQPQTELHLSIAAMLDIPNIIVCINKMDLVNYDEASYNALVKGIKALNLIKSEMHFIPTSATNGDCISAPSKNMPWYKGPSLLSLLETLPIRPLKASAAAFAVQLSHQINGEQFILGHVLSGKIECEAPLTQYPGERSISISKIYQGEKEVQVLTVSDYGTLQVREEAPVGNGVVLTDQFHKGKMSQIANAKLCWMDDTPLADKAYIFKSLVQKTSCELDVPAKGIVALNSIFKAQLKFDQSIFLSTYTQDKQLGAFILIDKETNNTVAAGTILQ